MTLDFENEKPIYLQLAEAIEDSILSGIFVEEAQIPSTTEISITYKINPATALKGINLLVEEGFIYKKRGVGMFVSSGAAQKIKAKHTEKFIETYVDALINEAQKLNLSKDEIITLISKHYK